MDSYSTSCAEKTLVRHSTDPKEQSGRDVAIPHPLKASKDRLVLVVLCGKLRPYTTVSIIEEFGRGARCTPGDIDGHGNEGSLFALNQNNLTTYLNTTFGNLVTADQVRALYRSGLSDNTVISELVKDIEFLWLSFFFFEKIITSSRTAVSPAELWGAAAVGVGTTDVYRYTYGTVKSNSTIVPELLIGAVFADLQFFPNAGAWHSSDLFEIFGTYPSDATAAEKTLSLTMQTIVANFARNPAATPAPNWPKYVPGNTTLTLAQLAYLSNVALSDVVETVRSVTVVSDSLDSPCDTLWNEFLDVRV
ncbi:hypothetical protein K438DRAFT_1784467 [Mycena galopus ATCC 62051]|nr:hypothetical protein K438DRAFT_1784467 [Mycena galopus ATCC 62051]